MRDPVFAIFVSFSYLAFLFAVAFITDRLRPALQTKLIGSPLVFTLSITVYCTTWTFYGAVGSAAKSGLEFITIYLGPTLVFFAWWTVLRKMVRIATQHRITSIADFLSARFGKSARLSVLVTLIALTATTPYISLQLQAVTTSFQALMGYASHGEPRFFLADLGFWVAVTMAFFVMLFGARLIDANEQHAGIVAAIAVESLVKLTAFVAIGVLVIFVLRLGYSLPETLQLNFSQASAKVMGLREGGELRWLALLFLSASAVLCLPRQFQVTIVENRDERHLGTASWLFPTYLFIMCIFTVPIAITGLRMLPDSNPDLFVLTVPLAAGFEGWALFAFIGGLSAATSMVIVACVALSTMMSNHLIMPLLLRLPLGLGRRGDLTPLLLRMRQLSIVIILTLGFLYYHFAQSNAGLASIGLIAFSGVAQLFPLLIIGLFWRGASEGGAVAGLMGGFAIWLTLLVVPSLQISGWQFLAALPDFQGVFTSMGWDPLVGTLFWSLSLNTALLVGVSLLQTQDPLQRLQAALFVDAFRSDRLDPSQLHVRSAAVEDLYDLVQRFVGRDRAYRAFRAYALRQGVSGHLPQPDQQLVPFVERLLAGRIGSASARLMVASVATGETISLDAVIQILDETQQAIAYSQALEAKSEELEATADQLRAANEQLKALDRMKDDFLSRVSHELRTPMTALRSMTEILTDTPDLTEQERTRFLSVISEESKRLTRLLDDILDVSRLEAGAGIATPLPLYPAQIAREALAVVEGAATQAKITLKDQLPPRPKSLVMGDPDRLKQVFVNLLSNAIKYNDNPNPHVVLSAERKGRDYLVHVSDNGPGISTHDQQYLFTKFSRSWQDVAATTSGTGLGLAISKLIVEQMQGDIILETQKGQGARFTVRLPLTN